MTPNILRGVLLLLPLVTLAEETKTLEKIQVASEPEPAETQAATKLPLTLRETPQSVTVIGREQLDDQKLETLREVLDQAPGIYSYAWDTERVTFTTRGFVIDNLLYDGVPATTNFSTDSIDETVDTAMYERIEVVRGATGLMTGAGSPAASVNLVRKRADSHEPGGHAGLTLGSWNDRRIEADVWTPLTGDGRVRARAVGAFQQRESYQDLYRNERTVLFGVVEADLTDDTLVSLAYTDQSNEPTSNTWGSFPLYLGDGTFADWPRDVTTSTDWAFWNRRTKSVVADLGHEFADGWSLHASLTWRRFDEKLALFYVYGFPDPVTGLGLDPYAYRSTAEITEKALDVYVSGPFEWLGREHELVVGYNGSRVRNTADEFGYATLAPVGNFFEWDGSYPEPDFDDTGLLLTDIDSRQNGLYVAARFTITDPATLVAGARFSTWKSDHFYLYDSPDVYFRTEYEKLIPYAGLIHDVSTNYSVFASFTEIFKPGIDRDASGAYLDPIDGRSLEVGVKGEHFEGRLNTALTLFETRQDNVPAPVYDPDSGEIVLRPDGTAVTQPIDGTRTRGFELEAAGALDEHWNLSFGWSRYLIEDADGAAIRTFVPGTLIRAFTTWKPNSRLALGGGINWQSESHTIVGSPDGGASLRQPDLLQLSFMARYQFSDALAVQVNGSNLLDEKFFVLDDYDNTCYGAPANYSASVIWSF